MAQVFARRNPGGACAVLHPVSRMHVVLEQGKPYDAADPLVEAYPWAFVTADELADANASERLTSVPIEAATARPGSKRTSKPRGSSKASKSPKK